MDFASRAAPPEWLYDYRCPPAHPFGGADDRLLEQPPCAGTWGGRIVASYDKHHLVPFGEYMPLRGILNFRVLTFGAVDSSSGPGPRTLSLPMRRPSAR